MKPFRTACLAAWILLVLTAGVEAASVGILAHDLKLVRSQGRVWKHADGWLLKLATKGEVVEGEFALPHDFPPGKYRVFLKVDNRSNSVFRLSLGGVTSAETRPQDRDWNGLWGDPVPLEIRGATGRLTVALANPEDPAGRTIIAILQAIYVTDQPDVVVDRNDCVVRQGPSAASDERALRAGNLVPNSSFEVGLGHGWDLAVPKERRDYSIEALWDASHAFHGKASVTLPPWASLVSRVIGLRPDRRHTFSLWARADAPGAQLTLELGSALEGPKDHKRAVLNKSFPLTSRWQRLAMAVRLPDDSGGQCQLKITAKDHAAWIDAMQLEEGEASAYGAKAPLELGLGCDKPANIFFDDEPVAMRLLACNSADRPFAAGIRYEIYDYLNRRVKEGDVQASVPANTTWQGPLDLSPGRRGIFRVVIWVDDEDGTDEEVAFCVVPRPQKEGPDPTSMIGVHALASDFQYEALKRLGVKWQRVLSPEAWFRWHAIEPAKGKFAWYDAEAQKTVAHGLEILGTIGTNEWPKWAVRDGRPDLDAWETSVGRIVEHYRPWVRHWEVWNEPIHQFSAESYAPMLQRAARAIRRVDPNAKVIGMGGSYDWKWCVDVIDRLGGNTRDHMDYLSTHIYPKDADPLNPLRDVAGKDFRQQIITARNLEVWNTEAGAWCLGFYQGPNSGFRYVGEAIWPRTEAWRYYRGADYEAGRVARNFLHSIGNGFTRYFYYDTRFHSYRSSGKTHCTIFCLGDTIRAKGVAYAVLARLFDHCRGLGDASPDRGTFAYLFDRGGTPLAALFARDTQDMTHTWTMTLDLAPGRFKVFDMMGNELKLASPTVDYGRQPVYLEGARGLSLADMRVAIAKGRIAAVPDATAPCLSICEAPRGRHRTRSARIRWIAIDEAAVPCDETLGSAMVYSYRLTGRDAEWSAWTPKTWVEYGGLGAGRYRFEVRAKDATGNVSAPAARDFSI